MFEPCLNALDINSCIWHVYPTDYQVLIEISPRFVCMATKEAFNITEVDKYLPFSGCICNLVCLEGKGTIPGYPT